MTTKPVILSIDQGTTSTRTLVFSISGDILFTAQKEFPQIYPADGWVEHNPDDLWITTLETLQKAYGFTRDQNLKVAGIGITNQRETTLVWNRKTGTCIYNAIVWQDRRTADMCRRIKTKMPETDVTAKTGLLLDPYFSATKVAWILDNVEGARDMAKSGDLAFGTVDSYIIYKLTNGATHATDATNASRTNLFNIHDQSWDTELLDLFDVPASVLPEVRDCADNYGQTHTELLGESLPILGVAGDQQAAAIGQCCFDIGAIKSTYGTGCFILINTGPTCIPSKNRLLSTIAYRLNGKTTYALEGSIFVAGAAIQWLRDELDSGRRIGTRKRAGQFLVSPGLRDVQILFARPLKASATKATIFLPLWRKTGFPLQLCGWMAAWSIMTGWCNFFPTLLICLLTARKLWKQRPSARPIWPGFKPDFIKACQISGGSGNVRRVSIPK